MKFEVAARTGDGTPTKAIPILQSYRKSVVRVLHIVKPCSWHFGAQYISYTSSHLLALAPICLCFLLPFSPISPCLPLPLSPICLVSLCICFPFAFFSLCIYSDLPCLLCICFLFGLFFFVSALEFMAHWQICGPSHNPAPPLSRTKSIY